MIYWLVKHSSCQVPPWRLPRCHGRTPAHSPVPRSAQRRNPPGPAARQTKGLLGFTDKMATFLLSSFDRNLWKISLHWKSLSEWKDSEKGAAWIKTSRPTFLVIFENAKETTDSTRTWTRGLTYQHSPIWAIKPFGWWRSQLVNQSLPVWGHQSEALTYNGRVKRSLTLAIYERRPCTKLHGLR